MRGLLLFFFFLHAITVIYEGGKDMDFYSVFTIFIVKNIGNICESRQKQLSGCIF